MRLLTKPLFGDGSTRLSLPSQIKFMGRHCEKQNLPQLDGAIASMVEEKRAHQFAALEEREESC